MAYVTVTLRIMPEDVEVDLNNIKSKIEHKIISFEGKIVRIEEEPIAFGLKALKFAFTMNEKKGTTDPLEQDISSLEGVNSVEVIDVRRTLG